jgi:hypothetical protein
MRIMGLLSVVVLVLFMAIPCLAIKYGLIGVKDGHLSVNVEGNRCGTWATNLIGKAVGVISRAFLSKVAMPAQGNGSKFGELGTQNEQERTPVDHPITFQPVSKPTKTMVYDAQPNIKVYDSLDDAMKATQAEEAETQALLKARASNNR